MCSKVSFDYCVNAGNSALVCSALTNKDIVHITGEEPVTDQGGKNKEEQGAYVTCRFASNGADQCRAPIVSIVKSQLAQQLVLSTYFSASRSTKMV